MKKKMQTGLDCKTLRTPPQPELEKSLSDSIKKQGRLTPQFVQHKGHNDNLRSRKKKKLVDRISQLEDELLVSILSLLPLKKAAATSILSRRWQYVWASTLSLNFDPDDEGMLGSLVYKSNPEIRKVERRKYVNWVNDVVERHRGHNVQHVRLSFDLNYKFSSHIDKWIQFAMKKGVQVLELDFLYYGTLFRGSGTCYGFPHEVLGVKTASDSRPVCCDNPTLHPNIYTSFKTLRVLHFKAVAVNGGVLEYFLSNCPLLEQLSVFNSPNLAKLRVCGPSIALKYLAIEECDALKSLEICDVSLVSFIYAGCKPTLLLQNVPSLVEVSVFDRFGISFNGILSDVFTQLPCCLSQLEIIKATPSRVYRENRVLPMLTNVKQLELAFDADFDDSLLRLNSFIKASPHLHKLILHVHSFGDTGPVTYKKAAKFSHHCLNEVEISGLAAFLPCHSSLRPCHIQLVQYLTEISVRLEKIIITRDWNSYKYLYSCYPMQRIRGEREERYERIRGWEQLKEHVPSIIELAGQ